MWPFQIPAVMPLVIYCTRWVFISPYWRAINYQSPLEVLLSSAVGSFIKMAVFCYSVSLIMSPSYYYHYHFTHDSCVLQCVTHHYNCYNCSYYCGPGSIRSAWCPYCCRCSSIGSAWCGSATTTDHKGHNEGFFWPCHCATAATTSVLHAFSAGPCKAGNRPWPNGKCRPHFKLYNINIFYQRAPFAPTRGSRPPKIISPCQLAPLCSGLLLRLMPVMPWVLLREFVFQIWASHKFIMLVTVMVLAFWLPCGCHVHQWGLLHWGLHCHNPMQYSLCSRCASWWRSMTHASSASSGCSFHYFK